MTAKAWELCLKKGATAGSNILWEVELPSSRVLQVFREFA